jgi:hypothetical protein
MPKVRRRDLPPQLYAHLLERIQQRNISREDLVLFIDWLDKQPEVPAKKWFKRFPNMTVCGEGELVKTFLASRQLPFGDEVQRKPEATQPLFEVLVSPITKPRLLNRKNCGGWYSRPAPPYRPRRGPVSGANRRTKKMKRERRAR